MGSPIAFQEVYKAGMEDFVLPVYEAAPNTVIQNRAMITRSLKAIGPVERVAIESVNLLQDEFGPSGEQVYEAENKDARIRFIGAWSSQSASHGPFVTSSTVGNFFETTFYGTGLILLMGPMASGSDFRATVDGGAEGANFASSSNGTLSARNQSPNVGVQVVTGLTLGLHTVKIRIVSVAAMNFNISGIDILNERSNLAVYSGQGISQGSIQGLAALSTSAFNAGVSGTRGARSFKCVQGGVLSSVVQEVNASAAFLTSANHANEEKTRKIFYRDIGANRAEDFSTITTTITTRSGTMDDASTTLSGGPQIRGDNGYNGTDATRAVAGVANFLSFTFTGSGLDILACSDSSRTSNIFVDGVSVGSVTVGNVVSQVVKIASGLPYGTHVVKFVNSSAGSDTFGISDFIIYQPKKPSIPAGALKVADYNLLSNYITSALPDNGYIAQGVIRKMISIREATYVGTWDAIALSVNTLGSGYNSRTVTNGSYVEFKFFGTGFEWRSIVQATANNATISVDGVSNFTASNGSFWTGALTTSFAQVGTGAAWSNTTGVLSGTNANGSAAIKIQIAGMNLGWHTVRFTHTGGAAGLYVDCVDIICPIHISDSTLRVGSQSLESLIKYSPEKSVSNSGPDLSKAKAWVNYDSINNRVISSFNVSAVLKTSTGNFNIYFEKSFKTSTGPTYMSANMSVLVTSSQAENRCAQFGPNYAWAQISNSAGTQVDPGVLAVVVFGELIDE